MAAAALRSAASLWARYEEPASPPGRAVAETDPASPVHVLWARIERDYRAGEAGPDACGASAEVLPAPLTA